MNNEYIIDLIKPENILCKKVLFKGGQEFFNNYYDPHLLIVKNDSGKAVVHVLNNRLNMNEKSMESITEYPFYILEMEESSCGCRYVSWKFYPDRESLKEIIEIDSMKDDLNWFRSNAVSALSHRS
jgi:hypothetical protein